jgi:hypothetical protein
MFFVAYWRSWQDASTGPLLGASVNEINIFFSRPRRAFFKIVCGLYEEMERSDENRALGNWILARNFLKNLF